MTSSSSAAARVAGRSPHARPVREADPAAGARQLPAPGDAQLGPGGRLRQRPVHLHGHLVRRRRQAVPTPGPLLRGRRHQAVRRGPVPAAPAGLRRAAVTSTVSSPAWPLGYDDFEPWYTQAEWLYQVHGNHGEDPTEGHWSKQYPWPAVSHEPRLQELSDNLKSGGYHPFHAPCGILLDEADRPKSTCIRCTWCDGYPCLVHAKSDAETIAVRPLLDRPNVTLLVDAEVVRLETDAGGRTVTGVVVSRAGTREVYEADVVVLSAGAANSAKILLSSAATGTPTGWPTARARWAATTCSTTAKPSSRWRRSPMTPSTRRPSASTISTSGSTTTRGRSGTSRWWASRTPRRCGARNPR